MKVTLINYTQNAARLLIFTKATRLNMTPALMDEIATWDDERVMEELAYMAQTIPSSWEMVNYVFLIEGVSRAFTHQLVRTRHGSYAQQSLRVVNASDFEYVYTERNKADPVAERIIARTHGAIADAYAALIEKGQPPEDARGILPTNIATNIVAQFNLRTMAELARSRTGGRTQNEYQTVMEAMATQVSIVHPWAELFMFPLGRDHFAEIEAFAKREFPNDLAKKGELLKIVDAMRKER